MEENLLTITVKQVEIESVEEKFSELFCKDKELNIERRIKVLTDGEDDAADPAIPVHILLESGRSICALYFSGGRVIHFASEQELLRGGVRPFHKIEVQTREGLPLVMEPYHLAEAIWDTELIPYKKLDSDQTQFIGHGGKMERIDRAVPCNVAHHNFRRSRHSFSVEFSIDTETKAVREVWKNIGPIHGNRPTNDGRWISRNEDQTHAHGYGSRMIRDKRGQLWRDADGFAWMTYEEVTEEVVLDNGSRLPFGTKIFARRMNMNLTTAEGPAILLSGYAPWDNPNQPYKATFRIDANHKPAGFLVEGPNPILLKINNKEYWTILFSAGDFVAEYGNFMMYREKEEGPIGPYRHVVDVKNELLDVTVDIVKKYDLTWAGRLNCFYDQQENLWGLMHGIFKDDIPEGWEKCGWPRTQEEFIHYSRRTLLVPLTAVIENNRPVIKIC